MWFWELQAAMGYDIDRLAEAGVETPAGMQTGVASDRDVIAERLAHARGEGPEPQADPMPAAAMALLGPGLIGPIPGADAPS